MSSFIYRFRTLESLQNYNELQNQEIYFSDANCLNDPIEDYKDIFWSGDKILWTNFFKHYLICLQNLYFKIRIGGEKYSIDDDSISIFLNYERLPTPIYKQSTLNLFKDFFKRKNVIQLLDGLSSRKNVRREELLLYLESIHMLSLYLVHKHDITNSDSDSVSTDEFPLFFDRNFFEVLAKAQSEVSNDIDVEAALFGVSYYNSYQSKLIKELNGEIALPHSKKFYLYDYPLKFLDKLSELMHWPWYTACFTKNPSNSSMWGYYTSGHTGVCLKFKTQVKRGKQGICLSYSESNDLKSSQETEKKSDLFLQFHKIKYNEKLQPIDFFQSIGRLSREELIKNWYSDDNNNISKVVKSTIQNHNTWRDDYWNCFLNNISVKSKEWSHEQELRLIYYSTLDDKIDKCRRLLRYNWSDLDGIIFGVKTPETVKLEIIKIVYEKCKLYRRQSFNFYQAFYNKVDGSISHYPMKMIKFNINKK
tara:strand:- start:3970 stop:5400 length:1431 start_codon:yes stop_codon:yes gene_type:complete